MASSERYYMQPRYSGRGHDGHRILLSPLNKSNKFDSVHLLETKKGQDNLPRLLPPRDVARDIGIPTELYVDNLTIAGQGTIGLKFRTEEGFRIVLNSNTDQSYGKTNVMVLEIGKDVSYFRKRNNNDPNDILAS